MQEARSVLEPRVLVLVLVPAARHTRLTLRMLRLALRPRERLAAAVR